MTDSLWTSYLEISLAHPFLAAFVQFLLLGTAGEIAAAMLRQGHRRFPFTAAKTALKALGWGVLGIYIKGMFLVATGGTQALIAHGVLPEAWKSPGGLDVVLLAAATSILMNVMLGPSMVLIHRLFDNAIDRALRQPAMGWAGIGAGIATLGWLWIPLHTFTFTQPKEIRIGIAAGLSLLLGVVMGAIRRPKA